MQIKKVLPIGAAFLILLASVLAAKPASEKTGKKAKPKTLTANEIMRNLESRKEPDDMISEMTMTLICKKGKKRVRKVLTARKGSKKTIMWFLSPADVKGASFLSMEQKGKNNMWIYLPALKKESSITSHGKGKKGYFMGSNFTYEDLEGRKYEDYSYKLLGNEMIGDRNCYVVESTPKPTLKKPSYSKIVSWIWKNHPIPLKEEYYNRMGEFQKVQTISKLKKIKSYWIPEEISMETVKLNNKRKTEITFTDIQVDRGIEESVFSKRSLRRIFNRNRLYKKKQTTAKQEKEKKQ